MGKIDKIRKELEVLIPLTSLKDATAHFKTANFFFLFGWSLIQQV